MNQVESLLVRLRRETARAHQRLDSHPVLQPLSTTVMDEGDYRRALRALYGAQCMLESLVTRRLTCSGGYEFQPRAPLLANDLAEMGEPLLEVEAVNRVVADSLPAVLGYLYVLEGSRMGARLIQRQVRTALGDAVPCRFFAASHASEQWQAFRQFIESECPSGEEARVCEAAQGAFACFLDGLERAASDGLPAQ